MSDRFRLTVAQMNPTVGDLEGNASLAMKAWRAGREAGAHLVALPELFITGYNPQDLVMKPAFHHAAIGCLGELARDCAEGPALAIGGPAIEAGRLYNAYHILDKGMVQASILKHHLPNDGVFDEMRLYHSGPIGGPYNISGLRLGSPICEDAWHVDVAETLAECGAELFLVPNGSPYSRDKTAVRQNHMVARVIETGLPLVYLNMVGAQDDQVFDGGSFVLNPGGALALQLPMFEEAIVHVDFERGERGWRALPGHLARLPEDLEQDYHAMVLSLHDYVRKSGFSKVLLGLSGGIDSALVATIAADAFGPDALRAVMLPSEYTSAASREDAQAIARNLGCRHDFVPIDAARAAIGDTLAPLFESRAPDVTEENIQSRLRGLILMALSNKFGEMLLTTGNKSEIAVGYATIYGDMAGGYNPLKDLYKTRVFEIARWRNATHRDWMKGPRGEVIPARVIAKAPSAELRVGQKDSDSLPDYPILDSILQILIDKDGSVADCLAAGHDLADVTQVENLIYASEHKRFQSAPGTRLSNRAFWLDRRYPMVNSWREATRKT